MTLYFTFDFKLLFISIPFFFFQLSYSLPDLFRVVPYEHRSIQQVTLEIATDICLLKFRDLIYIEIKIFDWINVRKKFTIPNSGFLECHLLYSRNTY